MSEQPSKLVATHAMRSHILHSIFTLLSRAINQYKSIPSFPEVFSLTAAVLSSVEEKSLPVAVRGVYTEMRNNIADALSTSLKVRLPLRMQAEAMRAIPLKTLAPEFDEHFTVHSGETLLDREAIQVQPLLTLYPLYRT